MLPLERPAEACPPQRDHDHALAARVGRGEVTAARELVERLLERVRATVCYLVASDPDAEDLVQAAIVEILCSAARFRGDARLETWADKITVRCTLRAISRRRRRDSQRVACDEGEPWVGDDVDAEQALMQRQLQRRVAARLQQLPAEQRAALVLRFVHGYAPAEIAELTDAPLNTVRDRLRVGKRKLRRLCDKDPLLRQWSETLAGNTGNALGGNALAGNAPAGNAPAGNKGADAP